MRCKCSAPRSRSAAAPAAVRSEVTVSRWHAIDYDASRRRSRNEKSCTRRRRCPTDTTAHRPRSPVSTPERSITVRGVEHPRRARTEPLLSQRSNGRRVSSLMRPSLDAEIHWISARRRSDRGCSRASGRRMPFVAVGRANAERSPSSTAVPRSAHAIWQRSAIPVS